MQRVQSSNSKCLFQSCILFTYGARNFVSWKGLVMPQIKTVLRPNCSVSTLGYNVLGVPCEILTTQPIFVAIRDPDSLCPWKPVVMKTFVLSIVKKQKQHLPHFLAEYYFRLPYLIIRHFRDYHFCDHKFRNYN